MPIEEIIKSIGVVSVTKKRCELCGFRQVDSVQMDVYHVDGNRNNTSVYNLKTICANCQRLKSTQDLGWQLGDLEVDE